METTACALCGTTDAPVLFEAEDVALGTPGRFPVRACDCGLIFLSPRPDADELPRHYPADYDPYVDTYPPGVETAVRILTRLRARNLLARGVPRGGRVLEIGCGAGRFLSALGAAGFRARGIDMDAGAVAQARARGGEAAEGTIDGEARPPEGYDAIVMRHVLEHVSSPASTLAEARRLLREGGLLVLEVPSARTPERSVFGRCWYGYDVPRHLWVYTPDTIRRLLARAGFRTEALGHSAVPNNWVGSLGHWLRTRGLPAPTVGNPLALAAALPLSILLRLLRRSGRITVHARPEAA